jgi:hypothetical protein
VRNADAITSVRRFPLSKGVLLASRNPAGFFEVSPHTNPWPRNGILSALHLSPPLDQVGPNVDSGDSKVKIFFLILM